MGGDFTGLACLYLDFNHFVDIEEPDLFSQVFGFDDALVSEVCQICGFFSEGMRWLPCRMIP